jgi:hypothetical protein
MALSVPQPQVDYIKKLVGLSDEQIAQFVDALAKAGPRFNVQDLALEVARHLDLPKEVVIGMVQVVGSLYVTKDTQNAQTNSFVDQEVFPALKRAGTFTKDSEDAQWKKLRKFLLDALALEDTVGTAAKAGSVLTQHEHIFMAAKILTDVRAIFHSNTSEKPQSAVIIHMLRVIYRDFQGNRSEHFFALDSNDVRSLKTVIDRALKKEETLTSLMREAKVDVLQPKEFY